MKTQHVLVISLSPRTLDILVRLKLGDFIVELKCKKVLLPAFIGKQFLNKWYGKIIKYGKYKICKIYVIFSLFDRKVRSAMCIISIDISSVFGR